MPAGLDLHVVPRLDLRVDAEVLAVGVEEAHVAQAPAEHARHPVRRDEPDLVFVHIHMNAAEPGSVVPRPFPGSTNA
ncbi:hypothetical protein Lesp01_64490 [Lentzea sp. NBRC 102530]|nr:hypothetical protein Lesp01_64490 [Lentzea sp. NBRC 102530]